MLLFYTPWKHQKTFRFSDVFRGYRKATPGCNGLSETYMKLIWILQLQISSKKSRFRFHFLVQIIALKMKFSIIDFFSKWPNQLGTANLVTFTEEILNGKNNFCAVNVFCVRKPSKGLGKQSLSVFLGLIHQKCHFSADPRIFCGKIICQVCLLDRKVFCFSFKHWIMKTLRRLNNINFKKE